MGNLKHSFSLMILPVPTGKGESARPQLGWTPGYSSR